MSTFKSFVIGLVVLTGGYRLWQGHERTVEARELHALADSNGFVPVQMPDGSPRDTVLILAPLNCPSAGAKRADALAARLTALGIPNARRNQYSISSVTPDQQAGIKHAFAVMNGEIPAVMFNGRGKANPTAEEIATEYRHD
jgi:hypothetical protein